MSAIVVTGASSGIGRAIAVHFSRLNMEVIATGRRQGKLEETKGLGNSSKIHTVVSDVSTVTGRTAIIKKLQNENLKVNYLVQNAGVIGEITNIENITPESWRKSFEINVDAPLFLTQELLKNDLFAKDARILHMGSGAAHSPIKGWPSYNVTKAAFLMLYRYLENELKDRNIFVGSLKPGVVVSEMQVAIREGDGSVFPALNHFKSLKENEITDTEPHAPTKGALDTAENVSHFIEYLFTKVKAEDFGKEEWDIRLPEHTNAWLNQ